MATTARMLGAERHCRHAQRLNNSPAELRKRSRTVYKPTSKATLPSAALLLAICPGQQSSKQVNLPARLPPELAAQQ